MPIIPKTIKTQLRALNKINVNPIEFLELFRSPHIKQVKEFLPESLGFCEINNKKVALSVLKQSKDGNCLIARFYNLSPEPESCSIVFCRELNIKNVKIVILLEKLPKKQIKANLNFTKYTIKLDLEPHVIVTLKILIEKKK